MNDEYEEFLRRFANREMDENLYSLIEFIHHLIQNVVEISGIDREIITIEITNYLVTNAIVSGHPECAKAIISNTQRTLDAYKKEVRH